MDGVRGGALVQRSGGIDPGLEKGLGLIPKWRDSNLADA